MSEIGRPNLRTTLCADVSCSVKHEGDDIGAFSVVGINGSDFDAFNSAMSVHSTCQSCIVHDLEIEDFQCDVEAGHTSCDQCMKFSNKAGCTLTDQSDTSMTVSHNALLQFELNCDVHVNGRVCRDHVNAFQHTEDLKMTYLNSELDTCMIKK